MRVLHVLTRDYRRGAEMFGLSLHQAMSSAGHSSSIVALAPPPPGHQSAGVAVLGSRGTRDPAALGRLRRAAAGADVVVAHGSDTLLACRIALIASRTPFVYVNIGDPLHWAGSVSRRLRVRWMLGGAAAVGAVAPSAVDRLVIHLGVPSERVRFTGNGRDSTHFRPPAGDERLRARQLWSLPDDSSVAVAVANLAPEKRLDVAIRAVARLPRWRLLVVGTGPQAGPLGRLAEQVASGQVVFAGELGDVRPALHAADVALLTSATEGLPGALLEAALCALPVVATDVGFVSDLVHQHLTGALVTVGDIDATVTALELCRRHRDEWGGAGRVHAAKLFDSTAVMARWDELLHDVVRSGRR